MRYELSKRLSQKNAFMQAARSCGFHLPTLRANADVAEV